jgi:hypothetical protein
MRSTRWTPRIGMAGVIAAGLVFASLLSAGEAGATAAVWRPQDGPHFSFGSRFDWPVVGDWNGDGKDEPGVFRGNTFHLGYAAVPPSRTVAFRFGRAGDMPIAGDWNGDGVDTVGVFRRGVFYLRNTNSTGAADEVIRFGSTTEGVDHPLIGDWDGDGRDELAVNRHDHVTIHVRDRGVVRFGNLDAQKFTGDWDGDGTTTFASRQGAAYITNTPCNPTCTEFPRHHDVIEYGIQTDVSFGADFDGDGRDEVGIVESALPPPLRGPERTWCWYFRTQPEAQRYVDYWYPTYRWLFDYYPQSDPTVGLDPDRDRIACELLPR